MRKQTTTFFCLLWILLLSTVQAQNVLFVTGPGLSNLGNGDQQVLARLQNSGYTVTIKGGSDPVAIADTAGQDAVFISATVSPNVIGTLFRDVSLPVIVSESLILDDMNMTGPTQNVDYGIASNVSQVEILNPSSPLVQPLTGTQTVTQANTTLRWGDPSNAADKVARLANTTNQYAVFSYDPGDQMVGLTAPGIRIGFFYHNNTGAHPTPAAWTLFDNAFTYALGSSSTCTADVGTIKVDEDPVTLTGGTATVTATLQGNQVVPAGYSIAYLLTTGNNLLIQQVDSVPSFVVNAAGTYSFHTLVYNPDPASADYFDLSTIQTGTTTVIDIALQINSSGICADVDLGGDEVTVIPCAADAGTLTIDADSVALSGGSAVVSATPDGNINVPAGYSVIYVLTSGSGLVIEQVSATPSFTVTADGDYTIHTLVYNGDSSSSDFLDLSIVQFGVTTGVDVLNVVTANNICASLDVAGAPVVVLPEPCTADAGTLTIDADSVALSGGSVVVSATPDGNINVPAGYSVIYVLTSGSALVIEQVSATPSFTVTDTGSYTIHTLVYNADTASSDFLDLSIVQFGVTTGVDVLNLVIANGICASLDVPGAPVTVLPEPCLADAGTLTIDADSVALSGGSAVVSATPDGNINVPAGYSVIYVLTSGSALVIEQVSATPSFTVTDTGSYTIHTLVFNADTASSDFLDLSIVQFGVTTGVDVLNLVIANNICASLDVPGAPVTVLPEPCAADAGTLTIDADPVSLVGGSATVSATPDGNINVPAGYSVIYVLTSGSALVIEQVSATPSFTVTDTGSYTIHTLVYNADTASSDFLDLSIVQFGVTTGVDVLNLVIANNICASLDVPGAPVTVQECLADAGTLTIDADPVSLVGGTATISATPDGNINVPAGYSVIYVLTSGSGLVIEQVSTTPSFAVTDTGDYTIHTLVYNGDSSSSDFLDLSIVQFGVTTGVDVLNVVTANGICASLDVAGAGVHVQACVADAGTLTIDADPVTLVGGSATVSATPDGNINVPAGYSVIYVLTSGSGLVIEQVSATPSFTVTVAGDYTIHTLVYNGDSTSSDFLDLSIVQFGVTTGVDVLNVVTANGICASLDVAGAGVHVQDCVADAGTLTIDFDPVSLVGGSANVSATPDGNINVPTGFSVIYVLTSGSTLVIEQVSATPSFTVTDTGDYTIHTLVYNADSSSGDFLDLSIVQFGVTTGVDVLNLVTANGICASLDVAGAGVHVQDCVADAGTLTIDADPVILTGGSATVSATPDGNINVPTGYSVIYVLTSGSNLVIEQVSATPSFAVTDTGDYTIHTLVYNADPNSSDFLDLSVVQFGVTTGVDVLTIVTTNGICASLDVAGAGVHVQPMMALGVFPNPFVSSPSVTNPNPMMLGLRILLTRTNGIPVWEMDLELHPGETIDLPMPNNLPQGIYILRFTDKANGLNQHTKVMKF